MLHKSFLFQRRPDRGLKRTCPVLSSGEDTTRLALSELENSTKQGGLGLPNIAVKAECLLLKQMLRILSRPQEDSFRHFGYWIGSFLREDFPELAELGPVSHMLQNKFPLHGQMLETLEEALMRQEVMMNNLSAVKTKYIYLSRMEDQATPPKG